MFGKKATTNVQKKRQISSLDTFGLGEEKEYFIENLGVLLASGMDIIEALESIKAEVKSKALKKIIIYLQDDIVGGSGLWEALERTKLLPKHIISLVKIGEASGRLEESLNVIVTQQQKTRSFKSKINSAMMYPVFVMVLALVVGIGVAWFILPNLSKVFSQLNLELPLVTRLLLGLGKFLSKEGTWAVPSFIGSIVFLAYFIFAFPYTKFLGQKLLFIIPGIKKLILQIELSRLGYIMGTLLQSGLPIVDAMDSLSEATPLHDYKKLYERLRDNLEEGKSFTEFFSVNKNIKKYIPVPAQGLIMVGERSGKLSKIFLNMGVTYEEKTDLTTKNLSVILEPVLLIIVWLGVVAVALAVILPIYSLVGGINEKPNAKKPVSLPSSSVQINQQAGVSATSATSTTNNISTETKEVELPPKTVSVTNTLQVIDTGLGYLNVRSEPSSKSSLVEKVDVGTVLKYSDLQNGWYKVIFPDQRTGWVKSDYVKILP